MTLIEELRDILTVKKLALEVRMTTEQAKKINDVCDKYLEALLPK